MREIRESDFLSAAKDLNARLHPGIEILRYAQEVFVRYAQEVFVRCAQEVFAVILVACLAIAALPAQRFAAVDAAVAKGITDGVYPGAVVVIGRADTILYAKGYGHFTWSKTTAVPDPNTTLWDLASLTKVVATMPSAAVLVEAKKLELDAPVQKYLPEFIGAGKDHVTVRMLLDHTSGLPAGAPFSTLTKTPAEARALLLKTPLARKPGAGVIYSDLNAMLAGLVVEKISGTTLDAFARTNVFNALGMKATIWKPAAVDKTRTAPTGHYRGTALGGEVNDQSARAMGGVSGNAGLFATAMDVAQYARSWLPVKDGEKNWAQANTLSSFLQGSKMSGSRLLGWDTPSLIPHSTFSLYGKCATPTTFGHTGWTGTMLWMDRGQNIFVVLMTNRAFDPKSPEASFKQLKEIRAMVSDAARRGAGGKC